ncbi:GntR family transcriptional regulator [Falsihalocynthiibacter sp. SS001]|uniref:GntR family transcriptional regulator n=1 Tax=Falsihalocynthiibacter sp. SS001 TaxID=3349698 RepID=UPI0036D2DDDD
MTETRKIPEHQAVYERLRDMILLGRFAPGQPLTIMGLSEHLGVGMTPVREAIRRLTAENALGTLGNRRVVVPELDAQNLRDIYFLRLKVEPELTSRAIKRINKRHIANLREIDHEIDTAINSGDVETYLERNNRFHFQIYALAKAPVLFRVALALWVQVGPSLRVNCGRYGTANLPDKHSELLNALENSDHEAASLAMRGDLEQSLSLATAALN